MATISTMATFQKNFDMRKLVANQSSDMNKAAMEVSSGLLADVYKDAPGQGTEALTLRNHLKTNETYLRSNGLLDGKLDTMQISIGEMRDKVSYLMNFIASGTMSETNRDVVQREAQQVLTEVVNRLNSTYAGAYIFSGKTTETPAYTLSDTYVATYGGSSGDELNAIIEDGLKMTYGINGDHDGFSTILQSLSKLATIDIEALDMAGYEALRDESIEAMSNGTKTLTAIEADLGNKMGIVERTMKQQQNLQRLYNEAVLRIEGVDENEAAIRLNSLVQGLDATMNIVARMNEMSLLKYL